MAKAIIEYDLNDRDDVMAHKRAIKSLDMSMAIFQLLFNTKKKLSFKLEEKNYKDYEVLSMVFDEIHEIMSEYNIEIDDLIE